MFTYKTTVPLVTGDATFHVTGATAITGGDGVHGTIADPGTTGKWIAGTNLHARKVLALAETTTVGSAVTEAKVYLMEAANANGGSAAALADGGAFTPVTGKRFAFELSLDSVDPTKFYGLGISYKASSTSNNTGTGGVLGLLLDPTYLA
jgi:hypothetical protein